MRRIGMSKKSRWGKKHSFFPRLEELESRFTPASAYQWTNALGNGVWEAGGNWFSATRMMPSAYPGWSGMAVTTDDTAIFNAGGNVGTPNSNCTMGATHILSGIQLTTSGAYAYTGTVTLNADL